MIHENEPWLCVAEILQEKKKAAGDQRSALLQEHFIASTLTSMWPKPLGKYHHQPLLLHHVCESTAALTRSVWIFTQTETFEEVGYSFSVVFRQRVSHYSCHRFRYGFCLMLWNWHSLSFPRIRRKTERTEDNVTCERLFKVMRNERAFARGMRECGAAVVFKLKASEKYKNGCVNVMLTDLLWFVKDKK